MAAMNSYPPGQGIYFTVTWTLFGTLVNPTTTTFTIVGPDDTYITATPVNISPGQYYAEASIPLGSRPGVWVARWQATGGTLSNVALVERPFVLQALQRATNSP